MKSLKSEYAKETRYLTRKAKCRRRFYGDL